MMTPEQLQDLIRTAPAGELLLLDLRVSPQYAQFHIKGALNLCIPTTLLKRATFNLQKLQQTFQSDDDRDKFARWRDARHLVVYDASSFERRDATSAMNMLKKFANEGYPGAMHVLRGGFNAFCAAYPDLVESNPDSSSSTSPQSRGARPGGGSRAHGDRPSIAPVVGGVVLPSALGSGSSPFFGNIRQNQDLVDGVGQMDIGVPPGLDRDTLPHWLRDAVDEQDHGKRVSDKFLEIELREKSRMTKAFSSAFPSNAATSNGPASQKAAAAEGRVQLSGLEQGGKNRYKDILPFEHARVRLEGKVEGSCDYVNASHLKSSGSHKRYIASQGPLPATFEVSDEPPLSLLSLGSAES
ncbi:hypothetical protein VTK73DRAFT_5599 [Phialemonium thermophilum]|uniref:Rhodanese domain-containing protein n=1 Tax=Phialemonium thermophilum TaxID=223376 RepID=A0ABR3V139_9PEZI